MNQWLVGKDLPSQPGRSILSRPGAHRAFGL
jgi:hypothetical protein